jgi:GT2 family glycosyltransferase
VLSLVVVTWNSEDVICGLLDALQQAPPTVPWEVLVVDNASSDRTLEVVDEHPVPVRVIRNSHNLGLAAANNIGMRAAGGSMFVICNPDTVPRPGALDALLDAAQRHPLAGFVIARLEHPDGELLSGVGDLPTFREAFAGRRAARVSGAEHGFWWDGWSHDEEVRVGHGQEACYLVRRATVEEVGPQDEKYWLDWEGVDWAHRLAERGWEVWFTPAARVVHLGGTSIRKAKVRWVVWSHRGMYRYFSRRGSRWRRAPLAVVISLRALAKFLLLARPGLYQRALRAQP